MPMKTTEAQRAAQKRYREKNREKETIQSYKRSGKKFIKDYATLVDLEELQNLINERKSILSDT